MPETATTGSTFLSRLRADTHALHVRAERHVGRVSELDDVHAYGRLLLAMYPVYRSLESRFEEFDEWAGLEPALDIQARHRSHLLADDLRALGVDATRGHAGHADPAIARFPHAFGALYVTEGSRLGGQVLARQVRAAVGAPAEGALHFFRGEGHHVGHGWNELRASLGRYAADADEDTRDAIVTGARSAFGSFDRELAGWNR